MGTSRSLFSFMYGPEQHTKSLSTTSPRVCLLSFAPQTTHLTSSRSSLRLSNPTTSNRFLSTAQHVQTMWFVLLA